MRFSVARSCASAPLVVAIAKDCEFNPQQAKAILAKAGYPNGFDLDLWYLPVSRPYFPTPKPIAEALAGDLSAIGVRGKLLTKDWSAEIFFHWC